jgi:ABC-type phosphate/phosphonate transport system substrate-binding protein
MKKFLTTLLAMVFIFGLVQPLFAADTLTCWFPPGWKKKAPQAQAIAKALSVKAEMKIRPRIAKSYPEILRAFDSNDKSLVYVGSFVQSIIAARKLGTPLVQNVNGKELYSGVLITPKGADAKSILAKNPTQISFALGASSGESSAKAATGGKAAIGVANHAAAVGAIKAGRAKAAVVKNWWWKSRAKDYPQMAMHLIPGVSIERNPDNVLTASKAVPASVQNKIKAAALASSSAFGKGANMQPFDAGKLAFSLGLMQKGKIDPIKYSW